MPFQLPDQEHQSNRFEHSLSLTVITDLESTVFIITFSNCCLLHKVGRIAKWWAVSQKYQTAGGITALVIGQIQSCFEQWDNLKVQKDVYILVFTCNINQLHK